MKTKAQGKTPAIAGGKIKNEIDLAHQIRQLSHPFAPATVSEFSREANINHLVGGHVFCQRLIELIDRPLFDADTMRHSVTVYIPGASDGPCSIRFPDNQLVGAQPINLDSGITAVRVCTRKVGEQQQVEAIWSALTVEAGKVVEDKTSQATFDFEEPYHLQSGDYSGPAFSESTITPMKAACIGYRILRCLATKRGDGTVADLRGDLKRTEEMVAIDNKNESGDPCLAIDGRSMNNMHPEMDKNGHVTFTLDTPIAWTWSTK